MADYDNTNRGSIWPNGKKETEKHPDFTGSINVEGVEYWVNAWKRKPTDDPKRPSLTFSVKRKEDKKASVKHEQAKSNGYQPQHDDFGDLEDLPF